MITCSDTKGHKDERHCKWYPGRLWLDNGLRMQVGGSSAAFRPSSRASMGTDWTRHGLRRVVTAPLLWRPPQQFYGALRASASGALRGGPTGWRLLWRPSKRPSVVIWPYCSPGDCSSCCRHRRLNDLKQRHPRLD